MSITAQMVKELREKTGAGMMDCKKALQENDANMEKAVDWLRQKGLSKAAKRAGRATTEGLIGYKPLRDGKCGVLIEVKCETDFVSRGDKFRDFVQVVTDHAAANFTEDTEALLAQPHGSGTLQDALNDAIATIGENMLIGRAVRVCGGDDGIVGSYVHSNGKIAVLVEVKTAVVNDAVQELAKNVAMQIAATSPLALDGDGLDPALLEREREVYRQKAREEGKPENIIDKIAEGAVKKYTKEVCLLDQPYIRDDKTTVRDLVKSVSSAVGTPVTLGRFVRLQLGVE